MCTLGSEYTPNATRQRPLTLTQNRHPAAIGGMRQLPRGRSPYRQSAQGVNMVITFLLKFFLLKYFFFLSRKTFIFSIQIRAIYLYVIYIYRYIYRNSRLVEHRYSADNARDRDHDHVRARTTRLHPIPVETSMIAVSAKLCTAYREISALQGELLMIGLAFNWYSLRNFTLYPKTY